MLVMVALAFAQRSPDGEIVWDFTTRNFGRLLGYGVDDNFEVNTAWLAPI